VPDVTLLRHWWRGLRAWTGVEVAAMLVALAALNVMLYADSTALVSGSFVVLVAVVCGAVAHSTWRMRRFSAALSDAERYRVASGGWEQMSDEQRQQWFARMRRATQGGP
jgi:hypothetical protein